MLTAVATYQILTIRPRLRPFEPRVRDASVAIDLDPGGHALVCLNLHPGKIR